MEFALCPDCSIISKHIDRLQKKYNCLIQNNIDRHLVLINLGSTIIQSANEATNLCEAIIAERQIYTNRKIKKFTKDLDSQTLRNNLVKCSEKKLSSRSGKEAPLKSKKDNNLEASIPLLKYKELQKLIAKQKYMYEDDICLFQSFNFNNKLDKYLEENHQYLLLICNMCKELEQQYVREQQENCQCQRVAHTIIDIAKREYKEQFSNMQQDIMNMEKNAIDMDIQKVIDNLKMELQARHNLVTKLGHQQVKMVEYLEKQKQQFHKNEESHRHRVTNLQNLLANTKSKYTKLQERHKLEGEGFRTDINNIRKDVAATNSKLHSLENTSDIYRSIANFKDSVNALDVSLLLIYP